MFQSENTESPFTASEQTHGYGKKIMSRARINSERKAGGAAEAAGINARMENQEEQKCDILNGEVEKGGSEIEGSRTGKRPRAHYGAANLPSRELLQ